MTRTTTTGYDSRGRFATSTTYPTSTLNPVVLSEARVVDPRFGIATKVTDANGVYTTKLVDGFGRVYGERSFNQANQKVGETFSAVETAGIVGNEKYRQRQKASGGGEVEVYHDELQREVRRRSKAFIDATYATTTLGYDAAGRKSDELGLRHAQSPGERIDHDQRGDLVAHLELRLRRHALAHGRGQRRGSAEVGVDHPVGQLHVLGKWPGT
ncbi:MAG: hypothetical protein DYH14_16475 [Betaproteobacteria bacterium PRO3]|nr:hypothetical protein [Betaproteobacteria bacterium PRO3]